MEFFGVLESYGPRVFGFVTFSFWKQKTDALQDQTHAHLFRNFRAWSLWTMNLGECGRWWHVNFPRTPTFSVQLNLLHSIFGGPSINMKRCQLGVGTATSAGYAYPRPHRRQTEDVGHQPRAGSKTALLGNKTVIRDPLGAQTSPKKPFPTFPWTQTSFSINKTE